jgi:type III secretion protein S
METLVFFQQAMWLVVVLAAPALVVSTLVGLSVSLLQALLSLQDQSLPFAAKLVCVGLVLGASGRWIGSELFQLTLGVFERIPAVGR